MKFKLLKGIHLHVGSPWRQGTLAFANPKSRDWKITRMWGFSFARRPYGFLGIMYVSPLDETPIILKGVEEDESF